jgi:thioredoxin reductase
MQYDVIVLGGSFAGLSAATYLARARLSVLVVDAGKPRNRFAAASHGFLSQDGVEPAAILAAARNQMSVYREAKIIDAIATGAARQRDGFRVEIGGSETAAAANLILATGVSDSLPNIPGLRERWGKSVAHCPYCHGYEFGGAPLGVLATGPHSLHHAMLIPEWGPVTFFLNEAITLDDSTSAKIKARGVTIETTPVAALDGEGRDQAVRLTDGRAINIAGLFVAPATSMTSPIADDMGCEFEETPVGAIVKTGADKQTSVPGLYAIGDMARPMHSVANAVQDGMMAAVSIHRARVPALS